MAFLTAQIEDEDMDALNALAAEQKVTRSVVVRWAIAAYVNQSMRSFKATNVTSKEQAEQPAEQAA